MAAVLCPIEARLAQLGFQLPSLSTPKGNYIPFRKSGSVVYISGQIPVLGDVSHKGTIPTTASIEQGQEAARACALNLIAWTKAACPNENLAYVKQILQVQGFVNCAPDFTQHPQIINGASDLLCEVFGQDVGAHSRFAVGCSSLPLGVMVEIGAVIDLKESL